MEHHTLPVVALRLEPQPHLLVNYMLRLKPPQQKA
jgi:hypothetical protein